MIKKLFAKIYAIFFITCVMLAPFISAYAEEEYLYLDREAVSEYARQGKHFQALAEYLKSTDRISSISERTSAGRSAWALGLINHAREIWQGVFAQKTFVGPERARTMLASAIMELQEKNYDQARAHAEEGIANVDASDLRSQLWLVIAESFKEQGANSKAESFYRKASLEGSDRIRAEATFLLGETLMNLGLMDNARYSFTSITTGSEYAPSALKRLVEIDFKQREYESVLTWIAEGTKTYPNEFDDPKISYAKIISLLEMEKYTQARDSLNNMQVRYSKSNNWAILSEAAVLNHEIKEIYPRVH
jgi:tetratricopeptide (TPR) repeat protein